MTTDPTPTDDDRRTRRQAAIDPTHTPSDLYTEALLAYLSASQERAERLAVQSRLQRTRVDER